MRRSRAGTGYSATVKTQVARILRTLDLRDCVQAVALACETGLIEPGFS